MEQDTTVVGLDVHKDVITAAVLPHSAARPREVVTIEHHPKAIARLVKRLTGSQQVVFVYEAGPCGYEIQRQFTALGCRAAVIAPALTPIRPGDRVKTNRRDAEKLARHHDRELAVCGNAKLVRLTRIEQVTLDYVFGGLFTPTRVEYLTRAVNTALQQAVRQAPSVAAQQEAALRQARQELENIAAAIRQGIITPTTRQMLEDAERRVSMLEQAVRQPIRRAARLVSVRTVVERYLRNLRATLQTNVDEARRMLSLALDRIVLQQDGRHLVAEFCGNVAGALRLEPEVLGCVGAGRGILRLPPRPQAVRIVT